jgi:DMSO/TMAO reductase YedYZ molybdopterin-dependent catalytic subunit
MGKINKGLLLSFRLSIVMMVVLVLSCSNIHPSPNQTSMAQTTETSPSPTINETSPINEPSPAIQTYQDLDSLRLVDDPAEIDNSKFPITPTNAIRVTGAALPVDITKYSLSVDGLVNTPLSLSYDSILKYPHVTEVVLLICEGAFVDNAEWTGVPVSTLLTQAGVKPEAKMVIFHGIDGYQIGLKLQDIQKDGVFLAYEVNGEVLPKEHGYPLRLVAKGKFGALWAKWVNRLELE